MKRPFEKNVLGQVTLKNRFVRSAAGAGVASKEGFMTGDVLNGYTRIASGGVAMVISEMMTVWDDGNFPEEYLRIDHDRYIDGLKGLADAIHQEGSKVIAQLGNHSSLLFREPVKTPFGPSAVADAITGIVPEAFTEEGIAMLISHFVNAAKRAQAAGWDGVELHAAHGFLLNKFINPYYNRRTDEYGGDTMGRSKIIVDIAKAVREACGPEFMILLKINSADYSEEEAGFTFDEALKVSRIVSTSGLDAIEVSSGIPGGKVSPARPIKEVAYNLEHAQAIAEAVEIPVIVVGGINKLEVAENILSNTSIHAVGMTRALQRTPNLIHLWETGQPVGKMCVGCNKCFMTEGQKCIFDKK